MMYVVGMCAGWCRVCKEFAPSFSRVAAENPDARFIWLDIEDDAEVLGDLEVESFPTIAVFRDGRALHFGVTLPQEALLRRLVEALGEEGRAAVTVPDDVLTLSERLERRAG